MKYLYYVISPARRDKTFKKLSLTTKTPIHYNELLDMQYQYALDNQIGKNQVIIECRDDNGILISRNNPYNYDDNLINSF